MIMTRMAFIVKSRYIQCSLFEANSQKSFFAWRCIYDSYEVFNEQLAGKDNWALMSLGITTSEQFFPGMKN